MLMRTVQFQLMNFKLGRIIALSGIVSKLKEMSQLPPGRRILEIGCGNGIGSRLIDKHFSPDEMIATDLDKRLVRVARRNNPDLDIAFEIGDATKLEYDDNEFDAVTAVYSLFHLQVKDQVKMFRKIRRWLKPEGKFLFTYAVKEYTGKDEFSGYIEFMGQQLYYSHTDPGSLEKQLQDAGFSSSDFQYIETGGETFLWVTAGI